MNDVVKISITIENEASDYRSTFDVHELIFTDYEYLIDYDTLKGKFTSALKASKNFTMITFELFAYDSKNYSSPNKHFEGVRYVRQFGEIKKANCNIGPNTYNEWRVVTDPKFTSVLKDFASEANRQFLLLLKKG